MAQQLADAHVPAADRMHLLRTAFLEVLSEKRLTFALAGQWYGTLMFLASKYFGRLGRALLRALFRRQHELHRVGLNQQLEAALRFWIASMETLRPREIPVSLSDAPVFLSYFGGEGEGAGVGFALWMPNGKCVGRYMRLPEEVRSVWSRQALAGDQYDIFEIEAVGPLL